MAQILLAVTPDGLGLKTCTAGLLARGSLGVSGLPEPCGPVADRSPSPLTVAGAAGVWAPQLGPPIPIPDYAPALCAASSTMRLLCAPFASRASRGQGRPRPS